MKNSDEAIDRVLAGLRDVEAPSGMERRVLAAMEARAAARSGFAWRGWAVGLAAVVVVVAGVMVSMGHRSVETQSVAAVKVSAVLPVEASVAAMPVKTLHRRTFETLRVAQNEVGVGAREEEEPVASGGIPAPPMPLTEQEKLLLHLATHADPQELTPLIAEVRAKKDAEFDAEFQEFFAPPEPAAAEKKTDPTNEDKGESR